MAKEKLLETLTADVEVCYKKEYWFYTIYKYNIVCCNENSLFIVQLFYLLYPLSEMITCRAITYKMM